CENLPKPGEAGTQSSDTDDILEDLFVPDNELIDYSPDPPDQTSGPLTAKNLEVLSNYTHSTTSQDGKKASEASTHHSSSVEEIVQQEEDPDQQQLQPTDKSDPDTSIENILTSLYQSSSPLKVVNYRNLDLVGDLVGRLIHFDLREPTLLRSQQFGPPPVAGRHGLLSWLTSQEKMAEKIIKAGSHDFFTWGWDPAIFSRSTGEWYFTSEEQKAVRDKSAWDILQKILPTSDVVTSSEIESNKRMPIPYEFRALARDFFSGKLVHDEDYYARLIEPEKSNDKTDSIEKLFHVTNIDMGKYRQNLYRNLYGPKREILKSGKKKEASGLDHVVNLFLLEVVKMNEIEDALFLIEKEEKLAKSSFTVAQLHGTDVRRSSRYHAYIEKLNKLEQNKKDAGKYAARSALEEFIKNVNIHGLDSIMGSETWSVTHISTIPTLDEPSQELTIIESINADDGNRSTSPLSIPENPEPQNETAPKKKKKKAKGKPNARKVEEKDDEAIDSAAVVETSSELTQSNAKAFLSIASDPLNYDFNDSENPVADEESNWETVKARNSKAKGPRETTHFDQARSAKQYNKKVRQKGDVPPRDNTTAASTTKANERFEVESFNDFSAITSPSKKLAIQESDGPSGGTKVVVQQPALLSVDLKGLAASGNDNDINAQISASRLPVLLKEQSILPAKVAAKYIYKIKKYNSSTFVDATQALTTSLSENSPPPPGLNLKDHAPVYLRAMLDAPSRASHLRKPRRSTSAEAKSLISSTLVMKRPASGCAKMSYKESIVDHNTAADIFSTADGGSLSVVDIIPADIVPGTIFAVNKSPVSDSASLDTIVNNAPKIAPKVKDLCLSEASTGNEEAPQLREASTIPVSGSSSATGSTMTIHSPQPQGFQPSFMGLGHLNMDFTVPNSLTNQTRDQQISMASYDVEEQNIPKFSNGWSQQKLSTSTILYAGQHTHADPGSDCTFFDCTYCAKKCYANTGSPMVLCHGCGTNSGIKYCSIACLLAESLSHADVCQESGHEILMVNNPATYQVYYAGPLVVSSPAELTNKKQTYAYRQKVFAMHCCDGPFPRLLQAWARKNNFTLKRQELAEAPKKTGSYFVFKSGLTSNGRRMNPDSTVICTIKFRPDDPMKQIVSRCLRACFSAHCKNNIKEFLFRLIKSFLSDDDSFGHFPHTEDRTTVFFEFQHQFHLEFGFHADMQRNSSDKFDMESEWPLVEHLLNQFETGEPI
ncbi:hypothetical protein DSL72_006402, partial [Monilinia vaccinii-corymbosi]